MVVALNMEDAGGHSDRGWVLSTVGISDGEQQPGSAVDVVAAAARPAGGIARPAPGEPPAPVPHPLFALFYLVEIRHRQLLQ
jgi:hypothetical protein